MVKGKVIFFNPTKGFGFIKDADEDDKQYFIHASGLADGVDPLDLRKDTAVKFNIEQSDRGPRATNLMLAVKPTPAAKTPPKKKAERTYNRNKILVSSPRPPGTRNRVFPGQKEEAD